MRRKSSRNLERLLKRVSNRAKDPVIAAMLEHLLDRQIEELHLVSISGVRVVMFRYRGDVGLWVEVPELPLTFSYGDDYEEALKNAKEAIELRRSV